MVQDYKKIAREIEDAIRRGELQPGQRLLPQRQFAWQRKIAISTATRVYAELTRRGLVSGEVGRGTFVIEHFPGTGMHGMGTIDMQRNYPVVEGQGKLLSDALSGLITPEWLGQSNADHSAVDLYEARRVVAAFLQRDGWSPDPLDVFFASNGREALTMAIRLASLSGKPMGVEAITYPLVKEIAARVGVPLVPIAIDAEGIVPEAVVQAVQCRQIGSLYVQPNLHNPLGLSMSLQRKKDIAHIAGRHDLLIVEDAVNSFLKNNSLLVGQAPERVIVVESLSKRVVPNITLGMMIVPDILRSQASTVARETVWGPLGWALPAAIKLISDGVVYKLETAKRQDASVRQNLAAQVLAPLTIVGDPDGYHLWIELPKPWRGNAFAIAMAERQISVSAGSDFAIVASHAPSAIRITLGTPPMETLRGALTILRDLALSPPPLNLSRAKRVEPSI